MIHKLATVGKCLRIITSSSDSCNSSRSRVGGWEKNLVRAVRKTSVKLFQDSVSTCILLLDKALLTKRFLTLIVILSPA